MNQQSIKAVQISPDTNAALGRGFVILKADETLPNPPIYVATKIEAFEKPGLHADIPYVRVWIEDEIVAEFCQHNIVGIYYETPEADQRRREELESRP